MRISFNLLAHENLRGQIEPSLAGRRFIASKFWLEHPRTIVITGSSSGFGLLTAKELAARGHTVVATMRDPKGRNHPAASELADFVGAGGGAISVFDLDVTSDESVAAAVAAIELQHGWIDVLVNNAGVMNIGVTETGKRPLRTVVMPKGIDFGVERLNKAVGGVQDALMESMQFGAMI